MSESTFNHNEIVSGYLASISKAAVPALQRAVNDAISNVPTVREARLREAMQKMIPELRAVNLLIMPDPIDIDLIYQPSFFRSRYDKCTDEITFRQIVSEGRFVLVRGAAGLGKSTFCKRHALRRIQEHKILPILIRLRSFNHSKNTFEDFLAEQYRGIAEWLTAEAVEKLASAGFIELILDGADEVTPARRIDMNKSLYELGGRLRSASIIVTTRPGDRFGSPGPIKETFDLLPMTLEAVTKMLRAIPGPNKSTSERLCERISSGALDRLADVISNPLLATIMLLTFERWGEELRGVHLYFRQAYETLYALHDVSKELGERRAHVSGLDIVELAEILGYVAALTYSRNQLSFSESTLVGLIQDAINAYGMSALASSVKDDIIESLSLVARDGLELKFAHRSIQEYFCAEYLIRAPSHLTKACFDAIKSRYKSDLVIGMAFSLNATKLRETWAIPTLTHYTERLTDPAVSDEEVVNLSLRLSLTLSPEGARLSSESLDLCVLDEVFGTSLRDDLKGHIILPSSHILYDTSGTISNSVLEYLTRAFPNNPQRTVLQTQRFERYDTISGSLPDNIGPSPVRAELFEALRNHLKDVIERALSLLKKMDAQGDAAALRAFGIQAGARAS